MNSKRKEEINSQDLPLKKRNTALKIAEAYVLDESDTLLFDSIKKSQKIAKKITDWSRGYDILNSDIKRKHVLLSTNYIWDQTKHFSKKNLLFMWAFAIISVYDTTSNTFKYREVTIKVNKEFSDKYYNHYNFKKVSNVSEVFDDDDLINYIIQNPSMWM
jgi:hypothetical protein